MTEKTIMLDKNGSSGAGGVSCSSYKDLSVAEKYIKAARTYPTYPKHLVDRIGLLLLKNVRCNQPNRQRVLVCSYGTGVIASLLADQVQNITVVSTNRVLIEKGKSISLGSAGSIYRAINANEVGRLQNKHPIRPATNYRCVSPERSGLPPSSFDLVVVEQAHAAEDISALLTELKRVARPSAAVVLLGYEYLEIVEHKDVNHVLLRQWYIYLRRRLTVSERHLMKRFKAVEFPFHESEVWLKDTWGKSYEMRAKWNILELCNHIDCWPVVQRVQRTNTCHGWFDLAQYRDTLSGVWGRRHRRLDVRWPLAVRVGFLS